MIINDCGELLSFCLTPGNTDDCKPVKKLTKSLFGKLFGDRRYLSKQLLETLLEEGLQLITTVRKNMKNRLMPIMDKRLLRKHFIIETINDQLKNISRIEHCRHRSINSFMLNLLAGLIAYPLQPKKPSLYERTSLILTSHLNFQEWAKIFGSAKATKGVIDRLTHHCKIIDTGQQSRRLKEGSKTPTI